MPWPIYYYFLLWQSFICLNPCLGAKWYNAPGWFAMVIIEVRGSANFHKNLMSIVRTCFGRMKRRLNQNQGSSKPVIFTKNMHTFLRGAFVSGEHLSYLIFPDGSIQTFHPQTQENIHALHVYWGDDDWFFCMNYMYKHSGGDLIKNAW